MLHYGMQVPQALVLYECEIVAYFSFFSKNFPDIHPIEIV